MRRLLLLSLLILMAVPIMAQDSSDAGLIGLVGARYNNGFSFGAGTVKPVSGPLYVGAYYEVGTKDRADNTDIYNAVGPEVMAIWQAPFLPGLFGGLIAGPEVQWYDLPNENASPTAYLSGAGGIVVGYWVNERFGIAGRALYKTNFDSESLFPDKFDLGIGLMVDLNI